MAVIENNGLYISRRNGMMESRHAVTQTKTTWHSGKERREAHQTKGIHAPEKEHEAIDGIIAKQATLEGAQSTGIRRKAGI